MTAAPKAGTATPRRGPRPLALHLMIANAVLLGSSAAWRSWSAPFGISPALMGLPGTQPPAPPDSGQTGAARLEVADAIDAEALARMDAFLSGIQAYRAHPYQRDLDEPPTAWQHGNARLLDYGGTAKAGGQRTVLFVPSLVNRAYILDLGRERSLLRWLADEDACGARLAPWLLDWGAPNTEERSFDVDRYVVERLEPALEHVVQQAGRPCTLAGYCMGGLLAIAAAVRRPDLVDGLVLLATPWDFHADSQAHAHLLAATWPHLQPILEVCGDLPVDALQSFFVALDPVLAVRKFARFAQRPMDGPQAANFVALEDWLNDGVPLAYPVAEQCFRRWYGSNEPGQGKWAIDGVAIRPEAIACRSLVIVPGQDRIVPPASAQALADGLPDATVMTPPIGHIGMIAGSNARTNVWQPLADWLAG